MDVLEGEDVVVARRADDRFGRIAARGEKAGVRSSVGDARNHPRVEHEIAEAVQARIDGQREEGGAETVGDGDVEQDVDRILAELLREVADGLVDERLRLLTE